MFKMRVLSIICMLPILLLALFKLSATYLDYFAGGLVILALIEWAQMLRLHNILTIMICTLFAAACFAARGYFDLQDYLLIFKLSTIFWILSFGLLLRFPVWSAVWRAPVIQVFYFIPLFVPAYLAFSYLNSTFGPSWLAFGLALIFGSDIGAYVFGKLFGAKKMAPAISPGKTIMGLYGAILSGIVISSLFAYFTQLGQYPWFLALGLVVVLFSVNGDLVQSALKRIHGIKDSGTLIPGHGGVFDRLDSIIGSLPVFALCSYYLLQANIINLDKL